MAKRRRQKSPITKAQKNALEDGIALAPDGTPIAAARQLRKMISR